MLAFALGLAAGPVAGAPPAGAKAKKEPAAEEKRKETATDAHKVKRGETLWGIARLHGVSVGDIMDLNHLSDSLVREGQVLKIPRPGFDPALAPSKATTHTLAKGETFRSIARKYGLTQEDLERANPKVDPDHPKTGSKLVIPATVDITEKLPPETGKPEPPRGIVHTVTDTDTYQRIAKKYGSTEAAIAAANPGVNPDRLRPGSKLTIPPRPSAPRKGEAASESAAGKKRPGVAAPAATDDGARPPAGDDAKPKTRRYVVSADETPQTISEAFNIPLDRLYEINGLKPGSALEPGREIQVPNATGGIAPPD
jgi:LysM repeat protein